MKGTVLGLVGLVALAAAACGGSGADGDGGADGLGTPDAIPPRGLALSVTHDLVGIAAASQLELTLGITRGTELQGDAEITLSGLPAGVTAAPLTAGSARVEVQLHLSADETVVVGTRTTATITGVVDGVTATAPLEIVIAGPGGTLDVSFGTAGVVTGGAEGRFVTDVFQAGATLVVGGYTKDGGGAYLQGFGEDGGAAGGFTEFTSRFASPAADVTRARFGQRPRGGFVGVATISGDVWVAGVRADGTPDPALPPMLRVDATGTFELGVVVVLSDDVVWIGGRVDGTAALVEIPADGDGNAVTHRLPELGDALIVAITVDASGRMVVLGTRDAGILPAGSAGGPVVARLTSEREVDPGYGVAGTVSLAVDDQDTTAFGVAFDGGGRLLVGGGIASPLGGELGGDGGGDLSAWRLTPDGDPDPGFSGDGRFQQASAESAEHAAWALPWRTNRTYLVGQIATAVAPELGLRTLLVALDDLGRIDRTFGPEGVGAAAPGPELEPAAVLRVSADRLVIAGVTPSTGALVLLRVWL